MILQHRLCKTAVGTIHRIVTELIGQIFKHTAVALENDHLVIRQIVIIHNRQIRFEVLAAIGQIVFALQEHNCLPDPAHTGHIVGSAADPAPAADGIHEIHLRSGILQPTGQHTALSPGSAQIVCKVHQSIKLLLIGLTVDVFAEVIDDFAVLLLQILHQQGLSLGLRQDNIGLVGFVRTTAGTIAHTPLVHIPVGFGHKTLHILDHVHHILAGGHLGVGLAAAELAQTNVIAVRTGVCRNPSGQHHQNKDKAYQTFLHIGSP